MNIHSFADFERAARWAEPFRSLPRRRGSRTLCALLMHGSTYQIEPENCGPSLMIGSSQFPAVTPQLRRRYRFTFWCVDHAEGTVFSNLDDEETGRDRLSERYGQKPRHIQVGDVEDPRNMQGQDPQVQQPFRPPGLPEKDRGSEQSFGQLDAKKLSALHARGTTESDFHDDLSTMCDYGSAVAQGRVPSHLQAQLEDDAKHKDGFKEHLCFRGG